MSKITRVIVILAPRTNENEPQEILESAQTEQWGRFRYTNGAICSVQQEIVL